jgi:hypothetical protein
MTIYKVEIDENFFLSDVAVPHHSGCLKRLSSATTLGVSQDTFEYIFGRISKILNV